MIALLKYIDFRNVKILSVGGGGGGENGVDLPTPLPGPPF